MSEASVFGTEYSSLYDCLYSDQDFAAEVRSVDQIVSEQMGKPKDKRRSLLDLGCGTGNHSFLLKNEFDVTGVDRSEGMLTAARRKSPELTFQQGDARTFDLGRKFDVVLMMSAVLGYQHTNEEVLETMQNVRRHLNDNGLFIFDIWHGPTVLLEAPKDRIKEIAKDGISVLRLVKPQLDAESNRCMCNYTWWATKDGQMVSGKESHMVRYFFPMELRLFLKVAGFKLLRIGKPGTVYRGVDLTCRDAMYVCQAV